MRWSNVALFLLEIILKSHLFSHCNYICAAAGAGDPESYYYIFRSKARKEKMGVCVFVFHSRGLFFFPRDLLEKEKKPWERKK